MQAATATAQNKARRELLLRNAHIAMIITSICAGALWGAIPAFFKAKFGTNETLFTLMMNYVATYLVAFFLLTWTPDGSSTLGRIEGVGMLPVLFGNPYVLIILVVALLTIAMYVYLNYTKQGYEIAVVGDSAETARYAGMKVNTIVLRTVFLSACLIGLAAAFKMGTVGTLSNAITNDVGWTGIIVAWLSQLNTIVIFVVSALICMLHYGSTIAAATFSRVDSSFANMLQGVILFLVLAADFYTRFRVVMDKKGGK